MSSLAYLIATLLILISQQSPGAIPENLVTVAKPTNEKFNLVLFGDLGRSPTRNKITRSMKSACNNRGGCGFAVMAGDQKNAGRTRSANVPIKGAVIATSLPEWISIFGLDKLDEAELEAARVHLCGHNGWKFLVGRRPIFSNGKQGDRLDVERKVLPIIKECGVHFYLTGGDNHQEHISGETFETVIQGTGAKLRDVDQKAYKPGDVYKQNFARSELGYALFEISQNHLELRFYDDETREIYGWHSKFNQVGLKNLSRIGNKEPIRKLDAP